MNLSFPILEKPPYPGKNPTFAQQQEFKSEYENWNKAMQRSIHNLQRVFALILGQCSDTIKNRICSNQQWSNINQEYDVTRLLTLIRDGLYQNAANLNKTHAMIEADERLNKFRQGDKMSVYEYREKMKSLIDIWVGNLVPLRYECLISWRGFQQIVVKSQKRQQGTTTWNQS